MTARVLERVAGRPLGRPTPSTLRDAARRGAHVMRHARLARPMDRGDVFNLDLHVSVVADVRTQLDRLGISLVDWTLSGHSWVAGRERDPVAVVNERTWFSFDPRMAKRFRRAYGPYLRSFRGFAAAYPPSFALLYEGLDKPTLALAATRYEWPFTHHAPRWDWLDDGLRRGVAEGWLTLVANNRADAHYLENYTGLRAVHIPSTCTYIETVYTGARPSVVVCTKSSALGTAICDELRAEAVPLRVTGRAAYTHAELYDHRALVFIPYNVSVMSLFEHYTACAPIYVPDKPFLKKLMIEYPGDVLAELSFAQVTGQPAVSHAGARDLNDVRDEQIVDWYLDRADFYDETWMPHIRLFESWQHLDHLLATEDQHAISAGMAAGRPGREGRIDGLWDSLNWTRALAR